MIVGIDIGGSTTDAVAIEDRNILRLITVEASDPIAAASGALGKLINSLNISLSDIERIAASGGGSRFLNNILLGIPLKKIDEITAIGIGGTTLANLKNALVVSIGTGTAMVSVKDSRIEHVSGTGVGGGTLLGLSKHILHISKLSTLENLAEKGNLEKIDLTVGDIAGGPVGDLPADATASNFGKTNSDAEDSDKALAIINMIAEIIVSLSVTAAKASNQKDIVLTGKLVRVKRIVERVRETKGLFDRNFIVPKYAEFATAIGAARSVEFF
ncbi:MAG: pantothenate kinase [Candidatus Methanofastidiosia archaeon]